jgi:hypothetical protein
MFPKTITVEVAQQDIDHGVRMSCSKCPVARAIARLYPELFSVRVDQNDITLCDRPMHVCFSCYLPTDVIDRIQLFDAHGLMEPFSFTVFHEG